MKRKLLNIPDHKPLVDMTPKELEQTFDMLGLGSDFRTLQSARRGNSEAKPIVIATAVLLPNDIIAFATMEYGDGDGIRMIQEWIAEINRTPELLLKGEQLKFELLEVLTSRPIPIPPRRRGTHGTP